MNQELSNFQWGVILTLVGIVFFILSYRVYRDTAGRKKRCSEVIPGKVIHEPLGDGLGVQPFAEYELDGQTGRISIFRRAFLDSMNDESRTNEDARRVVHELIKTRYSDGADISVYYNPKKHSEVFLEKDFIQGGKGLNWVMLLILGGASAATGSFYVFQ